MPARARTTAKSPAPADVAIGRNVRVRRLARGLSQTALARTLGVTFQQVQKYERGVNRIGSGRLTRIAEALGVPVAALFEGTEPDGHPEATPILHLLAEPDALRLLQAFARVQDIAARRLILALMELMAGRSRAD